MLPQFSPKIERGARELQSELLFVFMTADNILSKKLAGKK